MHVTAHGASHRDENDLRYAGWRVAGASSLGVFVGFASLFVYTFGIFLKPLAEEFHWSRQAVSSAFGVAAMSIAVCSPLLGAALDRFGPVRVIAPCVAVFGLAFAALSSLGGVAVAVLRALRRASAASATGRRTWGTRARWRRGSRHAAGWRWR